MTNLQQIPEHLAIIMDGNGRWAQKRLLPRLVGHKKGVDSIRTIVECCVKLNIPYLTLFAFSSENWHRPAKEVAGIISLMADALAIEVQKLHQENIRLNFIGDVSKFPLSLQQSIEVAQQLTMHNTKLIVNLAINYGGRWDLSQAIKKIVNTVVNNKLDLENINEAVIKANLSLGNLPDVDLLIRTSGVFRLSNFLLWELAYAELYFTDVLWPDFTLDELQRGLDFYAQQERIFGKTREQLARK
jgi:undecaprenyl diphosphate synthase